MRRIIAILLVAAAGVVLGTGAAAQSGANSTVAFVGVNVIPMDREVVLKGQTVVVRDGKIVSLGDKGLQVPDGAVRVDGTGKFLIPALAEMHAHIPGGDAPDALIERTLLLYAVNGLGTIRGMLGHPRHLAYRERAAKGEILSPRIYTSGPSLNGNSIPTKEAAIEAVKSQKAAGYDLLKIHPGVTREAFDALAATAHSVNIDFAGHVPLDVGLDRALEARYRSIDHLDGYLEAMSKDPTQSQFFGVNLVNDLDESKIGALVAATKKAGTWMVPTQVLMDNLMDDEDPADLAKRPEMQYALQAGDVQKWIAQKQSFMEKIPAADRAKFLTVRRRLLEALHDGGVPFALGSDAPQSWNVPGFSAHRELQALVLAGLTPYEALRTGTVNVATYFGHKDSGTVAEGNRGDLILLEANPLDDVSNTTKIAGVLIGGRWLPKTEIEKRLQGQS
jgi:Amidohydrolase family